MTAEAHEDRLRRHEAILEALAKVWTRQGEINEELRTFVARQDGINERLTQAIERLDTLLTRVLRNDTENGREA